MLKIPPIQSQVIPSSPCVKLKLIKEFVFHTEPFQSFRPEAHELEVFKYGSELRFFF